MQALYRKYRSKSLAEVVGQEHITKTLASAVKNGRISHAYLFTGPHGVGKTSVARILAHEINQLPYSEQPHLDIIEIDAASNRRIDDIRDLRDKVHIAPASAAYKVYIIDEVHMLTGESFNALLKTLEEPPAHVVFILATTEVHKLPATIISRTQRYSFRAAELEPLKKHLKHIAKQENITVDDEALQLIAEHGGGSYRNSISLLDQLANISGAVIDTATVEQTLGLAPRQALANMVEAILKKDHQAVIKQLSTLEQQGATSSALVPQLTRALTALAPKYPELYGLIDQLIEVPKAYNSSVKLLTILVQASLAHGDEAVPAKSSPTIAQAPKPILEISQSVPKNQKLPQPKPTAQDLQAKPQGELQSLTPEDWAHSLAALKVISVPLQTVFRHAAPSFDAKTQTLMLTFKYQLHRKRADDNKAKSALVQALRQTVQAAPIIKTEVDPKAEIPDITLPAPSLDDTAKSVAELMGGGEPVHA